MKLFLSVRLRFWKYFRKYFQVFGCDHEYEREREKKKKKKKKGGRGFQNEGKTKDLKRRIVENERVVEWCWVDCGVENVVPNSLEFV